MIHFLVRTKLLFFIFMIVLVGSPYISAAQSTQKLQKQFDKALQQYESRNFPEAIKELNRMVEKNPDFLDAYLLLSDIYKETHSTGLEIENLLKAQKISQKPLIDYHLAEAYFSLADYENALGQYKKYINNAKNLSDKQKAEIQRKTQNCRFAIKAKNNPVDFNPEKLSNKVNSEADEYWPVISLDQKKLVFTRLIQQTGQMPQEDFYFSEIDSAEWDWAKPIFEINTLQNEGAQILSADQRLLFFTACNRRDGKGSCDIYYSRFQNNKWSKAQNAGDAINSNSWEAQPAFSSDNRFLYFSSNRAGGKGAKDIWRIEFKGLNDRGGIIWGDLQNLGDSINTPGNEISPFIHPNNQNFYFVSDHHTGMGGFDLFTSELLSDSVFSAPANIGYPVNTQKDEQGLNISADGRIAYFASARENTGLDIYRFELDESLRPTPVTYVKANVIDAKSGQALEAKINLADISRPGTLRTETTDNAGELLVCLPLGADYAFHVSKENYLFYSQSFRLADAKTLREPYIFTIRLQPVETGAEMNLYNIYFETDSFSILPPSEPELIRLADFLNNNPTLSVEIQGHTDNTGSEEKNQELSELRAKSVTNYLVENGIDRQRLRYKGFGQYQPVADNETEEGRRQNRRTTVKIIEN